MWNTFWGQCGTPSGAMWNNHLHNGCTLKLIFVFDFFCAGRMVRTYQRKSQTQRSKHSGDDMAKALLALHDGSSFREVAATFNVPLSSLCRRYHGKVQSPQKFGRKTALLRSEEFAIAQNLATLGDFGLAMDTNNLRNFIKDYLDSNQRLIPVFNDNRPGPDWVSGFLKRHKTLLSARLCQNISRKRAAVSEEMVSLYFKNLEKTLEGVPPANIVNYDETNVTDDPKGKVQIFRRGTKHAERIMNSSKSSTSIMFAVSATGHYLSPYVVYKAQRLQQTWIEGGPLDVQYNTSKSGWFDADLFMSWFEKVALAYFRTLPREETKVLIGDNLASHINHTLIPLCEEHNIKMVFLIPNATHLLQPLDVGIFAPLKKHWRSVLTDWKTGAGQSYVTIPKWVFPKLLLKLMERMEPHWEPLAKASFKSCGIHPFDAECVLAKVRRQPTVQQQAERAGIVSPALLGFLQKTRDSSYQARGRGRGRGGRVKVEPGQALSLQDFLEAGPSGLEGSKGQRRLSFGSDSDTESEMSTVGVEESEGEEAVVSKEEHGVVERETEKVKVGGYVLVEFVGGGKTQRPVHYVGRVTGEEADGHVKVSYYRKTDAPAGGKYQDMFAFKQPVEPDDFVTDVKDIKVKLEVADMTKTLYLFKKCSFANLLVR